MIELPLFRCPNVDCRHEWVPRPQKGTRFAEIPIKCPRCQRSYRGVSGEQLLVKPAVSSGPAESPWQSVLAAVEASKNLEAKNYAEGGLRLAAGVLGINIPAGSVKAEVREIRTKKH